MLSISFDYDYFEINKIDKLVKFAFSFFDELIENKDSQDIFAGEHRVEHLLERETLLFNLLFKLKFTISCCDAEKTRKLLKHL